MDIEGIIPPQENAIYWEDSDGKLLDIKRNDILKEIDQTNIKEWKKNQYNRALEYEPVFSKQINHFSIEASVNLLKVF